MLFNVLRKKKNFIFLYYNIYIYTKRMKINSYNYKLKTIITGLWKDNFQLTANLLT